jgi:hypothetical protein
MFDRFADRVRALDRYLIGALLLAALCALYGIWWGWAESWNPDEMAFRSLFARRPFEPVDFLKPPFHTYVNFFLSVVPFKLAEQIARFVTGSDHSLAIERLWWSRLLQVFFFLGIVYLTYRIVLRFASTGAARVLALLTATSAGIILQSHFLTADIPVMFWMLASFHAAQSIVMDERTRTYIAAGLLVGIATATKYNGLAVGLAIPIFHMYARRDRSFRSLALDGRFLAAITMVVLGFIAANPYAVVNFRQFSSDFAYNYAVTPVYGGSGSANHGFADFLLTIPDIIGWPITVLAVVAIPYAISRLKHAEVAERATTTAALGVFALYFLQFGRAPRIEARFVLPVVSFLLIAAAPLCARALQRHRSVAIGGLALLVSYNLLACYWVGKRFAEDPRMAAERWVEAQVPAHSSFESSQYSPNWRLMRRVEIDDVRMPNVSGRAGVLSHLFSADDAMLQEIARRDSDAGIDWYTPESLAKRHPQYIALDSKYFDRFLREDVAALDYPGVRSFISKLLANDLGYHTVFEQTARSSPAWLYPADIDFVDNEIVILQQNSG